MSAIAELAERLVTDVPPALAASGVLPPAGAALGVRYGEHTWMAAAGHRTPDRDPMTTSTHHDLASITKALGTTTALLRLVSGGALTLDDPVTRFVAAFRGGAKDAVTLRHLLLHRGGLQEWLPTYVLASNPGGGPTNNDPTGNDPTGNDPTGNDPTNNSRADAAIRLAAQRPLVASVDVERRYSDLGFLLLGRVVEAATGQPLQRAVSELVTTPLGLASTRFAAPAGDEVATSALDDRVEMAMVDADAEYRTHPFARWRRSPVHGIVNDGNAHFSFDGVAGHAGLFSTLDDLLRFASVMADPQRHGGLWRAEVLDEFLRPGPDPVQALGWRRYELILDGERLPILGHPGFVGCAVGFVPGRRLALAMCTNRLLRGAAPVPTETMWAQLLDTAAALLTGTSASVRSAS